jgi:hypothetical protein
MIKEVKFMQYIARIQQETGDDLKQPYPYFISDEGFVGKQEFWKGRPHELLGFNDVPEPDKVSLLFEEFKKNIETAIGKYPVFRNKDGTIETYIIPVVKAKL